MTSSVKTAGPDRQVMNWEKIGQEATMEKLANLASSRENCEAAKCVAAWLCCCPCTACYNIGYWCGHNFNKAVPLPEDLNEISWQLACKICNYVGRSNENTSHFRWLTKNERELYNAAQQALYPGESTALEEHKGNTQALLL